MSILNRILLVVLSVGTLVASILVILTATDVLGQSPLDALTAVTAYPYNAYVIVIGVVFALIALRFLVYKVGSSQPDYVTLPGDYGSVRISFDTIEQLADRAGKNIRGVHELHTRVRTGQSGILLAVRLRVLPDIELAEMSNAIQNTIKAYVEKTSGVAVESVTVNIVELAGQGAKNMRARVDA